MQCLSAKNDIRAGPSWEADTGPIVSSMEMGTAIQKQQNRILLSLPSDAVQVAPLSTDAIAWICILVGWHAAGTWWPSWKPIRDRSFQSVTGMLYFAVVCALADESPARGLLLVVYYSEDSPA